MVKWFLPTFWGDIRLLSQGKDVTTVVLHGLTPTEKVAMEKVLQRAVQKGFTKSQWATPKQVKKIDLSSPLEQRLVLAAPILEVQATIAKVLKPKKKLLSVVRISGGQIEEVTEAMQGLIEAEASESSDPEASKDARPTTSAKPTVAATVSPPDRGCPEPDFPNADVRATEVLKAFLSPDQLADFERHQAFLAIGADTGHRYQVTSRHARSEMARVRRGLYDLDEGQPLCVHDHEVPASEEMLSIFLCLQIPGREHYLRVLPE